MNVKSKLRRFFLHEPYTITVTDLGSFKVGDCFWHGDRRWRIVGMDDHSLSVVKALTFKQRIARRLIKMLEWSPRQQVLECLYRAQEEESGQERGRYGRPAGRYRRRTRT